MTMKSSPTSLADALDDLDREAHAVLGVPPHASVRSLVRAVIIWLMR